MSLVPLIGIENQPQSSNLGRTLRFSHQTPKRYRDGIEGSGNVKVIPESERKRLCLSSLMNRNGQYACSNFLLVSSSEHKIKVKVTKIKIEDLEGSELNAALFFSPKTNAKDELSFFLSPDSSPRLSMSDLSVSEVSPRCFSPDLEFFQSTSDFIQRICSFGNKGMSSWVAIGDSFLIKMKRANMKVEIRQLNMHLESDRIAFSDAFEPECFESIKKGDQQYEIRCFEQIPGSLDSHLMRPILRLRVSSEESEFVELHKGILITGKDLLGFYNEIKFYLGTPKIYICDDAKFLDDSTLDYQKTKKKIESLLSQSKPIDFYQEQLESFNLSIRIYTSMMGDEAKTYYQKYIPNLQPAVISDWPRVPVAGMEDGETWKITQESGNYVKARDFLRELQLADLDLFYCKYFSKPYSLKTLTKTACPERSRRWTALKLKDLFNGISLKVVTVSGVIKATHQPSQELKEEHNKLASMQRHLVGMVLNDQVVLKGALEKETLFFKYASEFRKTDVFVDRLKD